MGYTIVGTPRSPFVRICRILLLKHGLKHDFQALNVLEDEKDAEILSKITPINKVPVLIDGDKKIFDSRVIVDYLSRKHSWPALTLENENIVTALYSAIDSTVLMYLMKRDGVDTTKGSFFISRTRERIPRNLDFIKPWAIKLNPKNDADWDFASATLYSYLYWAEKRELLDLKPYPHLKDFLEKFKSAPGLAETGF